MNSHMGQWMRNAIVLHNPNTEIIVPLLQYLYNVEATSYNSDIITNNNYSLRTAIIASSTGSISFGTINQFNSDTITIIGRFNIPEGIDAISYDWILVEYDGKVGWVASGAIYASNVNVDSIPLIDASLIDPLEAFDLEIHSNFILTAGN